MKYIKTYENTKNTIEDEYFKVGDIVKCIDPDGKYLQIGKCYTISNVSTTSIDTYYELIEIEKLNIYKFKFWNERFILASPKEIQQYKLEKNANKFNI